MSAGFAWQRHDDVGVSAARSGRTPLELPVHLQSGDTSCRGVTRDISQAGAFVATSRPYLVGERLILQLAVPGVVAVLAIEAEVRWLRPVTDAAGLPAGIGVSFVDPPFAVSLRLAWLLYARREVRL